ncbi:MAG: nuclear transport factor 2 family protein [Terracidiphilus sp.]|nr:nuclear transport factor 2 family protein [Terracidiphilus sp.]
MQTARSISRRIFNHLLLLQGLVALLVVATCAQPMMAGQPKQPKQNKQYKHDGRHQIDQQEEAWRVAVLKSDTNAMTNLLADDFMAITARGTLQTKDQLLANMRSGRVHLTSIEVSDHKVRFYGKTAVVTSVAHMEGTNVDGELMGDFRYTRVYVKNQQSEWKIVSFEASRMHSKEQNH